MAVNASIQMRSVTLSVETLTQLADFVSVAVGSACDLHRASNDLVKLGLRLNRKYWVDSLQLVASDPRQMRQRVDT